MFDETNDKWIKIYKAITIILFFGILLFSLVAGIGDATDNFLDILDIDGVFFDFIVWILVGAVVGTIHLVVNMLLIQLFNNIQIIREKVVIIREKVGKE